MHFRLEMEAAALAKALEVGDRGKSVKIKTLNIKLLSVSETNTK